MISDKEQREVYRERDYGINAAEVAESCKADREVIKFCGYTEALRSKENYHAWLDEMEAAGEPDGQPTIRPGDGLERR